MFIRINSHPHKCPHTYLHTQCHIQVGAPWFPALEERAARFQEYQEFEGSEIFSGGTSSEQMCKRLKDEEELGGYRLEFSELMTRLGVCRSVWDRDKTKDFKLRKSMAEDVCAVCNEAMHFDVSGADVVHAQGINALQALTVIKALQLLDTLTDRSEKDKHDDTEAILHIYHLTCTLLQESTYEGPLRTCPLSWRDNYRRICQRMFLHHASTHDEQSVRFVNQNSVTAAEKSNSAAKNLMDEASAYKRKIDAHNLCSACDGTICSDSKEFKEGQTQLDKQFDDLRTRIFRHEEAIRERLDKDPQYLSRKKLAEQRERKARKKGALSNESDHTIKVKPSDEEYAKADLIAKQLMEEEEKTTAAALKKKEAKAEKERKKKAAEEEERRKKEETQRAEREAEEQREMAREEERKEKERLEQERLEQEKRAREEEEQRWERVERDAEEAREESRHLLQEKEREVKEREENKREEQVSAQTNTEQAACGEKERAANMRDGHDTTEDDNTHAHAHTHTLDHTPPPPFPPTAHVTNKTGSTGPEVEGRGTPRTPSVAAVAAGEVKEGVTEAPGVVQAGAERRGWADSKGKATVATLFPPAPAAVAGGVGGGGGGGEQTPKIAKVDKAGDGSNATALPTSKGGGRGGGPLGAGDKFVGLIKQSFWKTLLPNGARNGKHPPVFCQQGSFDCMQCSF